MSQEKVNKYKEQKANRKEILAKEKRKKKLEKIAWILVCVVILAGIGTGIGFTVRNQWKEYQASKPDYSRTYKVISDMASVLTEDETDAPDESDAEDGTDAETPADESESQAE